MFKKDKCKHFTGIQHDECAVGVNYRELAGEPQFGMAKRIPCISDGPDVVHCCKFEAPTNEEIEESQRAFEEHWEKMKAVMAAIRPWRETHKGESFMEVVNCPACAGQLHLSIAAYNGHVHGKCETDGCVSWME